MGGELELRNLLQFSQNLVRRSHIRNRATHLTKHLITILIDDERRSKGDVFVLISLRMEQTIFADDSRAGVAQNCEVAMGGILPNLARVVLIVHAQRNDPRILCVKVRFSLRELAQLLYAERSPIAAIKVQNNLVAALVR